MSSATRTELAVLKSVEAERAFPSHAYGYGYLQGAIATAIIRLEYESPETVIAVLQKALDRSELPIREVDLAA